MSSGIVRRIDDLGRIVIPKEIRRELLIHEGDPLEIITSEDSITLKPYRLKNLSGLSMPLLKSFYQQFKIPAAVCDRHGIVASKGIGFSPYVKISDALLFQIDEEFEWLCEPGKDMIAFDDSKEYKAGAVFPIRTATNALGGIVLFYEEGEPFNVQQITCARFMAKILSNQLNLG